MADDTRTLRGTIVKVDDDWDETVAAMVELFRLPDDPPPSVPQPGDRDYVGFDETNDRS